MIRVVLDTNVVVSSALTDEGLPSAIFDLAMNNKILMVVSAKILVEYERVLNYPRLKLDSSRISGFLSDIRTTSEGSRHFILFGTRNQEGKYPQQLGPSRVAVVHQRDSIWSKIWEFPDSTCR